MSQQDQDYISSQRSSAQQIFTGINNLIIAQQLWNGRAYGDQTPGGTGLADGENQNEGISAAEVGAVVFDTANALKALLDGGHIGNIVKLL